MSGRTPGVILLSSFLVGLTACGGDSTPTEPDDTGGEPDPTVIAEVEVTPRSADFSSVGETQDFDAKAVDRQGDEVPGTSFAWRSSDPEVVTVDGTGLATARAEGSAEVIAEVEDPGEDTSGSASVQVQPSDPAPPEPAAVDRTLPARFFAASAWDPVNERILVHGGSDRRTHGELWSYDPSAGTWSMLADDGPIRWGHQAVFDEAGERLLTFAGNDGSEGFAMTSGVWSYDLSTDRWTQVNASGGPDPREQASVALAPERREMFAFGGQVGNKTDVANDLWVYQLDEDRWERLNPSGPVPEPRKGASMVWDGVQGRLLLYGGWNSADPRFQDLWAYDVEENTWTEITTGGEPPRRYRHGAAWDGVERAMYVFAGCCGRGGKFDDVWRYDAEEGSWSEVPTGSSGPFGRNRLNDQMLWDPTHEAFIVYGGLGDCGLMSDLWAFLPRQGRWKQLSRHGTAAPLERADHAAAALDGQVYVFGGCDGARLASDLVRLDPETGAVDVLQPSGPAPPPRSKLGMTAAPERGELYLFGGSTAEEAATNGLWAYDVRENAWRELAASGPTPQARFDPAWTWSPDEGAIFLFGGVNPARGDDQSERFLDDLWSFDPENGAWTEIEAPGAGSGPDPRKHQKGVWDAERDRLLLYGGHAQRDDGLKINYTDLWAYDPAGDGWTLLNDGGSGPVHRVDTGAAWDPETDQVLLYGGIRFVGPDSERRLGDLWGYGVSDDAWSELSSTGPGPRQQHELVLVPGIGRALIVGGYGGSEGRYLGSVWSYEPAADRWTEVR